jgi:hypothetical protein
VPLNWNDLRTSPANAGDVFYDQSDICLIGIRQNDADFMTFSCSAHQLALHLLWTNAVIFVIFPIAYLQMFHYNEYWNILKMGVSSYGSHAEKNHG